MAFPCMETVPGHMTLFWDFSDDVIARLPPFISTSASFLKFFLRLQMNNQLINDS